jgi:hypothetical protein
LVPERSAAIGSAMDAMEIKWLDIDASGKRCLSIAESVMARAR